MPLNLQAETLIQFNLNGILNDFKICSHSQMFHYLLTMKNIQ